MLDRELEKDLATHNRQISMSHPPEDSVTAASERQDPFQSVRPHGTQHQSSQLPAREAELVAKYSTHTAGDLTRLKELMMAKFIKDNALRNKTIRELETMAEKRASRALKRNCKRHLISSEWKRLVKCFKLTLYSESYSSKEDQAEQTGQAHEGWGTGVIKIRYECRCAGTLRHCK